MNAATFTSRKVKQWSGQCGRYGEHSKDVSAGELANASTPFLEGSLSLIGRVRRRVENDALASGRTNGLVRKDENSTALEFMPAGSRDEPHAAPHARGP